MKGIPTIIILISLIYFSFITKNETENYSKLIAIKWVDGLNKDFSFKKDWSYPEGIYRNKFGQLSCDGICPPGIDRMQDNKGRIFSDSLNAFYQLVDTTHLSHSIKAEAWTYEWAGTNFISFTRQIDNAIIGQTACSVSTHSSLNILIENDSMTAWIDLNSITTLGKQIFPMKSGQIKIDRENFQMGIIKAEFDMRFVNTVDPDKEIFWKGLIYSEIEK